MSIRPFTSREIESIKEAIEKNGWKADNRVETPFRYTIDKNNLLIFTMKFPIELKNVRLNIPYEIASFKISIVLKIWHLNKNTSKIIIYLLKAFKELADQVVLEPDLPIEGRIQNLMSLLNTIMPDVIKNENEIQTEKVEEYWQQKLQELKSTTKRRKIRQIIDTDMNKRLGYIFDLFDILFKLESSDKKRFELVGKTFKGLNDEEFEKIKIFLGNLQ